MRTSFTGSLVRIGAFAILGALVAACGGGHASSTSTAAQTDAQNVTGLPIYTNATDARTLPQMNRASGSYSEYTATSSDKLADVEAWYRQQLTGATETAKEDAFETGAEFAMPDNDLVDVYNDKTADASVVTITLLKYLGPAE
jgi:hypothetical protein